MRFGYEVFHQRVSDLVDFYVDVLGFAAADADAADYVVVQRGDLRVGCCQSDDAPTTPRRPPGGSEIVLRVEDVRAEHARAEASGWPIADPLQDRPWGLTDFRVFDPTGQYIRITSAATRPGDRSG